jgi:hypothetical protein
MTGEALEHVLLTAAVAGVHAGFSNQPCQVERLRARLTDHFALDGYPQVVVRMGIPSAIPPAPPRRRASDVIDEVIEPVVG